VSGWTAADIPDQSGRTVVVTGANSGLGLQTSAALARAGARVVLACRSAEKGEAARRQVGADATGPEPVLVLLDLADLSSFRAFADQLVAATGRVDVLVNNAGVMALPLTRTAQGFEAQFGTNHLGHFALTGLLLPLLARADAPRVVTVSSMAHRMGRMRWHDPNWEHGYRKWLAYGQSKLANLLFAFELDRRARAGGLPLTSVAAHPGYAATHLQAAGPEQSGNRLMLRSVALGNRILAQSDAMGALPPLYAATMPDVRGGEYFGPDRLFEQRGHPKRVRASRAAHDEAAGRRLWELSEQLTGVHFDFATGAGQAPGDDTGPDRGA
jgi:NAD(P)-dependent dehydrogenase (short-subunit alcohol dehydrogenase family)